MQDNSISGIQPSTQSKYPALNGRRFVLSPGRLACGLRSGLAQLQQQLQLQQQQLQQQVMQSQERSRKSKLLFFFLCGL